MHKILLAAMSDYFRAMFLGPMRESKENSVDLKVGYGHGALLNIHLLSSGENYVLYPMKLISQLSS